MQVSPSGWAHGLVRALTVKGAAVRGGGLGLAHNPQMPPPPPSLLQRELPFLTPCNVPCGRAASRPPGMATPVSSLRQSPRGAPEAAEEPWGRGTPRLARGRLLGVPTVGFTAAAPQTCWRLREVGWVQLDPHTRPEGAHEAAWCCLGGAGISWGICPGSLLTAVVSRSRLGPSDCSCLLTTSPKH